MSVLTAFLPSETVVEKHFNHTVIILVIRGFYPRGGGEVHVTVHPVQFLSAVSLLDRGEVAKVSVEVFTAGAVRAKVGGVGGSEGGGGGGGESEWSLFLISSMVIRWQEQPSNCSPRSYPQFP